MYCRHLRTLTVGGLMHALAAGLTLSVVSACASTNGSAKHPAANLVASTTHLSVSGTPALPVTVAEITVVPPHEGWQLGRISWLASGSDGLIYVLHRGDKADPLVVLDAKGNVVRSWGKELYTLPHSVRIDAEGNIWTTDAATSAVIKFSPDGTKLLHVAVGGQPAGCDQDPRRRGFCGATDVAWGPDGHVFVADGYANARIVQYTPDGQKVREWGRQGQAAGEFALPHSIAIDDQGVVYVADRENRRVQRFDLSGRLLGEWVTDGNPYTVAIDDAGAIWLDVLQPPEPGATRRRGRLLKVERASGLVLGYVDPPGGHGTDIARDGGTLLVPAGDKLYRLRMAPSRSQ